MLDALKNASLLALGALALSAPSSAQCIQPDYLWWGSFYDHPQCSLAPLTLPTFPGFNQEALELEWQDCALKTQDSVTVKWGAPFNPVSVPGAPASTQDMTSQVRLTDTSSGDLIGNGSFNLTYSRTWSEDSNTSKYWQVWRFLVNGDLRYSMSAGNPSLSVPACAVRHQGRVRYTGYVDWAVNCSTGEWSNSWMLTHAPDEFEHVPGHPREGGFHCARAFTFVGPANGFIANSLLPTESGMQGDDYRSLVRRVRRPKKALVPATGLASPSVFVPSSSFEEQVGFTIQPKAQGCPCASSGTGQFATATLVINGDFLTTLKSTDQLVTEFTSMSIGSWTDPSVYPGAEDVRWNIAEYEYFEPCTNSSRMEIFHGVTTMGGHEAFAVSKGFLFDPGYWTEWLPTLFIDQSNALRKGKTSMNLPFRSDHILNLNSEVW
jgi:hypothetical protein